MSEDRSKYKFTIGSTSLLIMLGVGGIFAILMFFSSELLSSQGDGSGLGILTWIIIAFSGIPLLIATFITGIIAIAKNKGRIEGIIALSAMSIMVVEVMRIFSDLQSAAGQ